MHAPEPQFGERRGRAALRVAEPRQGKELAALVERHGVTAGLHVVGQGQHVTGVDVPARHAELAHHVVHADETNLDVRHLPVDLVGEKTSPAPRRG